MDTLSNVATRRGEVNPPSIRIKSDTIPEAISSNTGVSVRYVPSAEMNWYVLRASYGRERKVSDYIIHDGTFTYIATRYVKKNINGKVKTYLVNLIPNILFVYASRQKVENYVRDTPALSFLSFYYNHFELDSQQKNPPLVVPRKEMENFILATCNHSEHLKFINESQCHYKGGEDVVVTEGLFKGVEGKVARVLGQQRIVVSISNIGLVSTAYIPSAFIKRIR